MKIEQKKSPNCNARRGTDVPSLLVLHYTGMKTADEALARMCDPVAEVSAHYMVDEDGSVTQMVDDESRAWHAGVSHWAGEADVNSHSIGIEIVNLGHEFGYRPFSEVQIAAVMALSKSLIQRHNISPLGVVAHSDIAPDRKTDPGELFPWQRLANEGIGLWPQPNDMDKEAAADLITNQDALHILLCGLGYDPMAEFSDIIMAFHRRYCPEKFDANANPEDLCVDGVSKLLALVRAHHNLKT